MPTKKIKRPTPHKDWSLRRGVEKQRIFMKEYETNLALNKPRLVTVDEAAPDGTLLCAFTINYKPVTKKTHQQAVFRAGAPRVLPSPQYAYFEKCAEKACREAWELIEKPPMDFGMAMKIRIFTDTWQVGDHSGYMQAIGDVLQFWGVILNDKFIHWHHELDEHWFGGKDPENPRVEIEIRRFRHPYEQYRQDNIEKEDQKTARAEAKLEAKKSTCLPGAIPSFE